MGKIIGTGGSSRRDARRAAEEATRDALQRVGTSRVSFGFVFASPDLDLKIVTVEVRRVTGCNDIIASTTAGEFTEIGRVDGVVVMLVLSDETSHQVDFGKSIKAAHRSVAEQFARVSGEAKQAARAAGRRHLTSVLLADGLSGTGEYLVHEMFENSTSSGQIVGGAAGDAGRFKETFVAAGRDCASDSAAVLSVFDTKPWGVGVKHGLRPTTKPMRVTRSEGNVIHTIEAQPAFEVYRRHAMERGITLTPETAGSYMIANELGVHFFSSLSRARAPLSVDARGALSCAAPVPEGSFVSILDGDPDTMIGAAKSAAEEARERLGSAQAAGVLLFDCVCRGMILGPRFGEEVQAVRSVFGEVPVAGFLTYGEIAKIAGSLDGWHNATAVVVAIPG